MSEWKLTEISPNSRAVAVIVTPIKESKMARTNIMPIQNVPDLWQAFHILIEATGSVAASFHNDNPVGITDYEQMAQYVSMEITKVIMSAEPAKGES